MEAKFPVVDISPFTTSPSTEESRAKVASQLTAACHRYGFVAITGHGIEPTLLHETFQILQRLFALPHEDKMKAPHPSGAVPHRGYSAPGTEKVYTKEQASDTADAVRKVADFKESYEVGSESNERHYNIWLPESVLPGFRAFSLDLFWRLNALGETILGALAIGLGLTAEETRYLTKELRSGHNNQLRYLHYPAVPREMVDREMVARMPAHTDWSMMTLLFQDRIGGLELENLERKGSFVEARPMEGALVLNVGDMLERVTNGFLPSALHRVVLPSFECVSESRTGDETPERYSVPYFFSCDDDSVVRTLESCVRNGDERRYEDVKFADYGGMRERHSYV